MVIGKGYTDQFLNIDEIRSICAEAFNSMDLTDKRLLFIIPDNSRTCPMDLMFRIVYELLSEKIESLDFLIALGTHPPLSDDAINKRVGITQEDRLSKFPKARFFNHHWNDETHLRKIGTLRSEQLFEISGGMLEENVDVRSIK